MLEGPPQSQWAGLRTEATASKTVLIRDWKIFLLEQKRKMFQAMKMWLLIIPVLVAKQKKLLLT